MKFYEISNGLGETIGCELSKTKAIKVAKSYGLDQFSITMIECPVNAETIRRLLGNIGSYATKVKTVYIKE